MRKLTNLLAALCLLLFVSCQAEKEYYVFTSFHEPANEGLRYLISQDGRHWDSIPGIWLKPELGQHKLMRDPSMARTADGTYHLVWTTSWKGDLGFGHATSRDLIHWSEQEMVPVMAHEPTTVNVWAPEIYYDDVKDELMVVWASCIPGRFENGIEADDNNHRLYYITTKDFKTISETKLFYDPGFSCIDATIVKQGPEEYVMVVKDNTRPERNLKVAFATSPVGPYSAASEPFTKSFVEGPTVEKIGEEYWIYFDVYKNKIYGAVRTKDFRSFADETNRVTLPQGHKHGTIFRAPESLIKGLMEKAKAKKDEATAK
ncbi:glycoside hydrolase family 43 protein [Bacteroides sp.]|uniref:glycoside hydrolase family 43 protein n=1 Tax=Bacteroides sp. TaxID=29523 RepID=UPI001B601244|nr:glycoside hydrolase family 43 protein [Bacteroides sp.]MBP6065446.1 glycoside hydrolase family 43 protein [Bacteroides sp.]MBP6067617.1 glycoside hydrolase family 43 protein [Bacteroides sp.]MBP6936575.1 glycoside hydrolase family 43 protein [Bacteroides sp.]MBP8621942.1 glycoside hydrolase family 43 protein [Bacteroides sp.]MBP9508100.1 glycoside hydrolase family 43 protein [Bacteroides sp.]